MIVGIIAVIIVSLLIVHYIYTNWRKFREIRRSWNPSIAPLPTVNAVYVENIPNNSIIVDVREVI